MLIAPFFRGKDYFCRPSFFKSGVNKFSIEANYWLPFRGCKTFSLEIYFHVVSTIAHLLRFGSPSAVFRFVISIIVQAIQRQSFWHFPHVRKKRGKVFPPITNFNASGSVIFIRRVIWTIAPSVHHRPNAVDLGLAGTVFEWHGATISGNANQIQFVNT
jgi:hypothetical protein